MELAFDDQPCYCPCYCCIQILVLDDKHNIYMMRSYMNVVRSAYIWELVHSPGQCIMIFIIYIISANKHSLDTVNPFDLSSIKFSVYTLHVLVFVQCSNQMKGLVIYITSYAQSLLTSF